MSDEKKIIIDEDWKSQVEAEREQLKAKSSSPQQRMSDAPAGSPTDIPAASIELLVSSLATQALIDLGQLPNPADNKYSLQLDLAKHNIDMLSVLEQKTKGNLTTNEAKMLDDVLHQLRMAYVTLSGGPPKS
jgi:hypothetical protein